MNLKKLQQRVVKLEKRMSQVESQQRVIDERSDQNQNDIDPLRNKIWKMYHMILLILVSTVIGVGTYILSEFSLLPNMSESGIIVNLLKLNPFI